MNNQTLHKLIWVLIFGGLLSVAFGLSLAEYSRAGGATVITLGAAAAALGAFLIWWRSRRS